MPKITTQREELIIYKPEWEATLQKAEKMYGLWLTCWLAFDCIFGKRRNEICRLRYGDAWVQDGYLYCRFRVGKKRNRTATIDKMPYTKKITLKHYAVHYVTAYMEEFKKEHKHEEEIKKLYIFPSNRKESELTVHTKCRTRNGSTEIREYYYHVEGGYMSGQNVLYYIKKVNPNIWAHLGRHSVATGAAEDGATEYDIANIIDVTPRTASKYVHHGTKLTERWSERTA